MSTGAFQQAPVRNDSIEGYKVYSHSGEFAPNVTDLTIPCRGLSFALIRTYRSAHRSRGDAFGHGWSFTYAKRVERDGDQILYHDGKGRTYRLHREPRSHRYIAARELYAVLVIEEDKVELRHAVGLVLSFEKFDVGGRLLAIRDRNGNTLKFEHSNHALHVTDSFGRLVTFTYKGGRIVQLSDYGGRVWEYNYDRHDCLIEVIEPPTDSSPGGTNKSYEYDNSRRLISISDSKGQTFLRNHYDENSRIRRQDHGAGYFTFKYDHVGTTDAGFPRYRTEVRRKNSAKLALEHDDLGHVIEQISYVSAAFLSPEDRQGITGATVPLTTSNTFNINGELTSRAYPSGCKTEWVYDEHQEDPRARGNLLKRRNCLRHAK